MEVVVSRGAAPHSQIEHRSVQEALWVRSAGWLVCSADCALGEAMMKIGIGQVMGLDQGL